MEFKNIVKIAPNKAQAIATEDSKGKQAYANANVKEINGEFFFDKPLAKIGDDFTGTGSQTLTYENYMEGVCIVNNSSEVIYIYTDNDRTEIQGNEMFYQRVRPFKTLEIQATATASYRGYVLGGVY